LAFYINPDDQKPYWFWSGQCLLLYGLVVTTIAALIHGVAPYDFIRDLIGFIFLLIPLLFISFLKNKIRAIGFLYVCLFIGLAFSVRTIFPDTLLNIRGSELLYLANSPLVLFSSIFFIGYVAQKLFTRITIENFLLFFLGFLASLICLLAMMNDIRRASFIAVILSLLIFTMIGFVKNPVRTILPLCLLMAILLLLQEDILAVIGQITLKTSQVGLNMRLQEWHAVWQAVNSDTLTLLFGRGWGAMFESPAVGGLSVSFTHSLLSALLLKSGLIGLLLCLVYLFFIFEKLVRVVFSKHIVAGIALFWPFVIAVLFYASYKSLDFGLLLTLIIIWHKTEEPELTYE
jgi:hypothetical protein